MKSDPVALFVSDVHLQPALPQTTAAFLAFLDKFARKTTQLYVLGDLFEYWAGDDDIETPFNARIAGALRNTGEAGVELFWIGGNRDFLIGSQFAEAAGMTPLTEPFVSEIAGRRVALVHGDAQCTDDHAYMEFRRKVRTADWQRDFLAMPLAQRKAIIEGMRNGSREAQKDKSYDILDVNQEAIDSLVRETGASLLIHGHTHRPATHEHQVDGRACIRHVLPDWDCDHGTPRGGWLGIDAGGMVRRYGIDGIERAV